MTQVDKKTFYDKINPTNAKASLTWDDETRCVTSTFKYRGATLGKVVEIRTKGLLSNTYYLN